MNRKLLVLAVALSCAVTLRARATYEVTATLQKELDRQIEQIKAWAGDPSLVKAVLWGNRMGPVGGMDNEKWRTVRRSDELIRGYMTNDAGRLLVKKLEASNGLYVRAFVCGTKGEQIGLTEKTDSYFYAGQPRFDFPFKTAMPWQGPPELDADTDAYDIQIAAPVLSFGKPIGVLVVGVNLTKLEKTIGK